MEKNDENKLNINKVTFNTNQKANSRYILSNPKPSDKSSDYKITTEEIRFPERKKTKLTKRVNTISDIVKLDNISFDDDKNNSNNFQRKVVCRAQRRFKENPYIKTQVDSIK